MTILFYLPAIIPRWFERLFVPLIERLAGQHQVHILAPVLWSGTGLGSRELGLCAHLPGVRYHIVSDPGHPSMRTEPVEREAIIAFVQALAPDITFCRSADFETPRAFPGTVRYITEAGADPLLLPLDTVHLVDHPFEHGLMPELSAGECALLDRLIEPYWERLLGPPSEIAAQWLQLPGDRPTVFVPLEYEDEENVFAHHRVPTRPNAQFVRELAQTYGEAAFFAITNHPLNIARADGSALAEAVAEHPKSLRLFPYESPFKTPTRAHLAQHCDAMWIGDSKMFALAAAHGQPIIRQSRFRSAKWLGVYETLEAYLEDAATGRVKGPDPLAARRWFACHAANNCLNIQDPALTGEELLARAQKPVDPARWERNFAFFAQGWAKR